jgi:hypothetical protein
MAPQRRMRRWSGGSRSSRRGSRRCRRGSGRLSVQGTRERADAGGAESSAPWDSRRSVHGVGDGNEAFSAQVSSPCLRVEEAVEGVLVE